LWPYRLAPPHLDDDDKEEVHVMQWDLGIVGLTVLAAMTLGFGLIAHLAIGREGPRWTWLAAGAAYFVLGLAISELWFGWATEEDLQPNIDGLSFDETLLGLVPGVVAIVLVRRHVRRSRRSGTDTARTPSG
jgi:hypothetical protein